MLKRLSLPILQAITNPSPETEEAAWNAILPAVDQLKEFYDFSNELGMYDVNPFYLANWLMAQLFNRGRLSEASCGALQR